MDYSVIQENRDLRAQSRSQLKGVWGKMALAILVYYLITMVPQFLFWEYGFLHIPLLETIITIAVFVVMGPFALGLVGYFLKRIRQEEFCLNNIFDGFLKFLPSFLLMFFYMLFIFLWTLLLIVPGLIKMYAYSMVFYIMYDNPEIKPLDAIKQSKIMMKGYKGKLFLLHLSFIGWGFLCILTLGIGFLWLMPYMMLAEGNFYENLKKNQEKPAAGSSSGEGQE